MREALGLSLQAAALKAGVDVATLQKIEAGGRGTTVSALERVADSYGISLTDLVAGCERARGAA